MTRPGTRILLVEDDRSISRLLQLELEHREIVVEPVFDGSAALPALERFAPDAIVLDILLPGMDGERVLQEIRRRGYRTPVIMLTARDKQHDKVRNLDSGADDYLTKPFDIEELLARLRAVMRRVERDEVLRAGDLEIDVAARQVRRGARTIDLTAREYDLLEYLARNARRVLPRDLILEQVWSATPDADPNVVDVYIGYLRRKIDLPGEQRLIHTIRGVGFALRER
ncbi:MAG: response regulator transcription factor [Thermomicrobiales bacterium]|nr:response regulator transcription factor [Thermomicrobiales bacterium]